MNGQMMEEVQRCIDQNRKTKDTKLDVSCRGLREIPEAIFELKHLKQLYLIGNEITYISPKIGQLINLELLDVSGNQIESVPREIASLIHLRELHLLNNKIDTLPEDIKQLNKTLNVLALSGNRFEIIPPVVFELTQLHTLWMNYNRLKHIPAELGVNLPRLRKLAFAFNQVEEVSATLGQLAHLEVLIARCNKLRTLPAELLNCTSLHHFAIDSNRFFKRPAATASTAPQSRAVPSLLGLTSRAIVNSNMAASWCDASPRAMPEELWHLLFDQTLTCASCEKQFCINELERIGFSNLNHLSCDVVHIPLVFRFCSPQCMDLAQTNGIADVKVFHTRDEVTAIAKHVI